MIEINKKEECSGCYGCVNICPKECISMIIDDEGFWYPKVDKSKCIDCNLCVKVCQIYKSPMKEEHIPVAYACRSTDEYIRTQSSSGGLFTLLSKEIINLGGVIFGAAFDEKFEVRHMYAKTIDECAKFRGSKYVQSNIGGAYKQVEEFLKDGKVVLFSGTQCQVKGLNMYLMKKYNNLITIDIICHGVPSPKVFKSYRENLVKLNGAQIKEIRFRDKIKGWREFSFVAEFSNNNIYCKTLDKDMYIKGFLNDLYLRPSCYTCTSKNFTNASDISLADYWGVQAKHPELDDDKGVSLVIINSKKGDQIFKLVSKEIDSIKTDLEFAITKNKCIITPINYNPKREEFFREFNGDNLLELIKKHTKISYFKYFKNKIRRICGKVKRFGIKYKGN